VPLVPEVPAFPEAEDELEPSRGCASSDDDEGERFELRPCAFERLDFLVTDELELVSSLVFPAIAASSLPAELFEIESGVASLRR
jgi:hypothetical protein